jgi:hypothetical protein
VEARRWCHDAGRGRARAMRHRARADLGWRGAEARAALRPGVRAASGRQRRGGARRRGDEALVQHRDCEAPGARIKAGVEPARQGWSGTEARRRGGAVLARRGRSRSWSDVEAGPGGTKTRRRCGVGAVRHWAAQIWGGMDPARRGQGRGNEAPGSGAGCRARRPRPAMGQWDGGGAGADGVVLIGSG